MPLKRRSLSRSYPGIEDVLRKGSRISSELFHIKFIPISGSSSRFSIIAGLRVSKKAVIRNKIKRRVREVARTSVSGAKRGYFIVITVKPEAVNKEFPYLKRDLADILNKINQ